MLCSSCSTSINPTFYKGHFVKHFIGFKGKEKDKVILRAISILNELQVNSLPLSLDLILSFSNSNSLPPFQELEILSPLYKCSFCYLIKSNKDNI